MHSTKHRRERDYSRWLIAQAFRDALKGHERDRHFIQLEGEFIARCRDAGFDGRTIRELLLMLIEMNERKPVAA